MAVKVTKLSTPVQCSNEIELPSAPSLCYTSIFSSGDSHTDNLKPVKKNKTYIQDIHDVEITNAKAIVQAKYKNEDETELKKTHQTASAISAEVNSKSRTVYFKRAGWS